MKDQIVDACPRPLLFLESQGVVPEFEKSAADSQVESLAPNAFACPGKRLFPVHTKRAAWESNVYFTGSGYTDPQVKDNLEKAAKAWGIEEDVSHAVSMFTTQQVKSASANRYALEVDGLGYYPLGSEFERELSADAMVEDHHEGRLPLPLFRKAAREMVKNAGDMGLPLKVLRLGESRLPDFEGARAELPLRKEAAKDSYSMYEDILNTAEQEYTESQEDPLTKAAALEKYADLMCECDESLGIRYDDRVVDPYSLLFTGASAREIEKAARETVFICDRMVPLQAMLAIPEQDLRNHFRTPDAELLMEFQKSASEGVVDIYEVRECLNMFDEGFSESLLKLCLKHG